MAAFSLAIDGNPVAVVSMDLHGKVSVSVNGQQGDKDLAYLTLSGGSRPGNGEPILHTWVRKLPLRAGQVLTVAFLEHAAFSHLGKAFAVQCHELGHDRLSETLSDSGKDYRTGPKLRGKYSFRIVCSTGIAHEEETQIDDFGFLFSVIWNSLNPGQAEVSLSTYTFDEMEALEVGKERFAEVIHFGESARFQIRPS